MMPVEYSAQAASPIVNGETKLTINEAGLSALALFDAAQVPFADINGIALEDYVVTVSTDGGDYAFSRMGNWVQPFFDELRDAYNMAVLRALFIKGSPLLTARGDFTAVEAPWDEKAVTIKDVPVHVYGNCVVALPPDLGARRVPLCFVSGMDKGGYELKLKLDTGESYTFAKLGFETAPFADAVEKQIRALREQSLAAAREIDPTLSVAQASQIAKLAPHGAAVSFGRLAAAAPSFLAALEAKLANTRAAESYKAFAEQCSREQIHVGFRKNETREAAASQPDSEMPLEDQPDPDPYLLWLIAPSRNGQCAAVEFAVADSATFVYRTGGDFDGFARQLSRALEAIDFKREVVRLTDFELLKPENSSYSMAAKRTAALQFVRANFIGRIIHSSNETWKRKLSELWGSP
ncbi:MAG: hypothetical protein FWG42_06685 [Clostridiales bacterium]|nr:hypothetical protein [Clostridiales bacterium]